MSAEHWGRRPRDWAELAEPSNRPLFAEVLSRLGVGDGTRLLDIGCGSGYAAAMAAALGASVTGIDITPELIEIARERVPDADFRVGTMDALPYADASFDAAVGFNAFQFADDPDHAVREAARAVRPGGLVAATTFAEPERNESTGLHLALEPLREAAPATGTHAPYELSAPGGLERLLSAAPASNSSTAARSRSRGRTTRSSRRCAPCSPRAAARWPSRRPASLRRAARSSRPSPRSLHPTDPSA